MSEVPKVKPRKEKKDKKEAVGHIKDKGANNESDTEGIEAKDIGLKFYTSKERGWPQNKFSISELIEGLLSNKI